MVTNEQAFFLITFSCYLGAVRLLWFSRVLKPFKAWTTFMHEFSHAIAAWLTCNKVTGIEYPRRDSNPGLSLASD